MKKRNLRIRAKYRHGLTDKQQRQMANFTK